MTREEAIDIIKCLAWHTRPNEEDIEQAIEALSVESCEDAISRQVVLDMMQMRMGGKELYKAVYDLPSVTPKVEECEDAISRQAVLDLIEHYNSDGLGSVFYGYEEGVKFADSVNKLPSVNPKPKMGRWIYKPMKGQFCSICDEQSVWKFNYCPNCGAKMGESEDEE